MRKVILGLAVSLDGYIEGPNGEYDWCFTDQDYGLSDFFDRIDALFMGRRSWEMMQTMKKSGQGDESGMGFPKMTQYVFSNTLVETNDESILVKGDICTHVREIKDSPGKDIWLFGGADLTASLMKLRLVDELWLSVHPVLLGGGKPLFQSLGDRVPLRLQSSKVYNTGLLSTTYEVLKD